MRQHVPNDGADVVMAFGRISKGKDPLGTYRDDRIEAQKPGLLGTI